MRACGTAQGKQVGRDQRDPRRVQNGKRDLLVGGNPGARIGALELLHCRQRKGGGGISDSQKIGTEVRADLVQPFPGFGGGWNNNNGNNGGGFNNNGNNGFNGGNNGGWNNNNGNNGGGFNGGGNGNTNGGGNGGGENGGGNA